MWAQGNKLINTDSNAHSKTVTSKVYTPLNESIVSQNEIDWALKLETKVKQENYHPNLQEVRAYQIIIEKLSRTASIKENKSDTLYSVTQQEIQWALELENKVSKQNYKPKPNEISQYQAIASKLQNNHSVQANTSNTILNKNEVSQGENQRILDKKSKDSIHKLQLNNKVIQKDKKSPKVQDQSQPHSEIDNDKSLEIDPKTQIEIQWALELENKVKKINYQPTSEEIIRYDTLVKKLSTEKFVTPE